MVHRLQGQIQRYPWGDTHTIAHIQQRGPSGDPEAELWLGAHPTAPSLVGPYDQPLDEYLIADPLATLGPGVSARFGGLPYLLKILAAAQPLSIQAHPDVRQAQRGYNREQEAGVPLQDPSRTYRDPNHKPELICALGRFEAKSGFRPVSGAVDVLDLVRTGVHGPRLEALRAQLTEASGVAVGDYGSALSWLLSLDQVQRVELVTEIGSGARAALRGDPGSYGPELDWAVKLAGSYPDDSGVALSLLLNHITLEAGQAMFLSAGVLHSYLHGAGVEIMANSDNVVRGGLTTKYTNVGELAEIVDPTPSSPQVQTPGGRCHQFEVPVADFGLWRIAGSHQVRFVPQGPEIVLVTSGTARLESLAGGEKPLELGSGDAAFVSYSDGAYRVEPSGDALVWRATTGH